MKKATGVCFYKVNQPTLKCKPMRVETALISYNFGLLERDTWNLRKNI